MFEIDPPNSWKSLIKVIIIIIGIPLLILLTKFINIGIGYAFNIKNI